MPKNSIGTTKVNEIIRSMLLLGIYFCFFFNGVLSSPLEVAWLGTRGLGLDFGGFVWKLGRALSRAFYLGISTYGCFIYVP
jgi:hypothetical protein